MHFTYDDHQAGTALQEVPGQPNRVRAVRDSRWKYGLYFDPAGKAPPEYELYDLDRDRNEMRNLVGRLSGEAFDVADLAALTQMRERLDAAMAANGTAPA
jgi:arylsulfatase A-like enzyme